MEPQAKSISWDAPEHFNGPKTGDWFFALTVITVALVIAALIFGDALVALLCAVGGGAMAISAARPPRMISYAISGRGVKIDDEVHPYSELRSFYINENDPRGPHLLLRGGKNFVPLLVIPIPEDYLDEIDEIIAERLPEEVLEEPFFNKLLEFFGF